MTKRLPIIVLALLALVGGNASAQGVLETARNKWAELAGRSESARSRPVELPAAHDTWGEAPGAVPRAVLRPEQLTDERALDDRGWDDRNAARQRPSADPRNSVHRTSEAGTPVQNTAPNRAVPREEINRTSGTGGTVGTGAAEPGNSTRVSAQPNRALHASATPAPSARASAPSAPSSRASVVSEGDSVQERLARIERLLSQPGAQPAAAAPGRVSCVNVARAWEGAAALAQRGQHERAYDAYVKLLASCTDPRELEGTVFEALKHLPPAFHARLMNEPVLASPRMAGVHYILAVQAMFAANEAREGRRALALARELRPQMLARSDAAALVVSGWLEQRARAHREAESLFRAAIRADREGMSQREGLVVALLAQDKVAQAAAEVERVEGESAVLLRGEVRLAQARAALNSGEGESALRLLAEAERMGVDIDEAFLATRAWALKASRRPEQAAQIFKRLHSSNPAEPKHREGLYESLVAARDYAGLRQMAQSRDEFGQRATEVLAARLRSQGRRAEAAQLLGQRLEGMGGGASVAMNVRNKSGAAGEDRLLQVTAPQLGVTVPLSTASRVEVTAESVHVDNARQSTTGTELRARYVREGPTTVTVGAGLSRVSGVDRLTLELLLRRHLESGGHIEAGLFREPVMDSVRSYAGSLISRERALLPGQSTPIIDQVLVGQAMRTGLRGAGRHLLSEQFSLDWSAGAGAVTGTNIATNSYFEGRAALLKDIAMPGFGWFSAGPELSFASWQNNENRFGQIASGGYFSPRTDLGMGLRFAGTSEEGARLMYRVAGYGGFASRSGLADSDSSMVFDLHTGVSYLFASHLIGHAGLKLRTSAGFAESSAHFGLSIPFETRTRLSSEDLRQR